MKSSLPARSLLVATLAIPACAFAGTFSYDTVSANAGILVSPGEGEPIGATGEAFAGDLSEGLLVSDPISQPVTGQAVVQATYNFEIVYTPDPDEAAPPSEASVWVEASGTASGDGATVGTSLDSALDATPSQITSVGTDPETGSGSYVDPESGVTVIPATGAMESEAAIDTSTWVSLSRTRHTVTLTPQSDGTLVGYLSLATSEVGLTGAGTAGETLQIDDIVAGGGL